MKFVIIELDSDGVLVEPWLVEAPTVKAALKEYALSTDLNNMLEDYEEDFVNSYKEETHHVGCDQFEVYIYNLSEMRRIPS